MTLSPLDSTIFGPLFGDDAVNEVFSDEQFLKQLLQVEAALASVQGKLGIIPSQAADTIVSGVITLSVDAARLRMGTERAGFPIIELVRQLRDHVGDAAEYVHWGATTQDVMDTALVLQLRAAVGLLEVKLSDLIQSLGELANRTRHIVMAGRTHSQQALPITFGLKVAGWLAPLLRHHRRLDELSPRLFVVQFGGAAGTLAALGARGIAVQEALAAELSLGVSTMPWHTQRDGLAELAGWLSLVSGGLAKLAQDVILLAQTEVAEVGESNDRARGGSSSMPQKSNPFASECILAAARANASLLASMHQALVQEHERATHGWQLEWLTLPQMLALTAGAVKHALFLSKRLKVDEARMRENVAASNGLMLSEAVVAALAETLGRDRAKALVEAAAKAAMADRRHLVDVVREQSDAPLDWAALKDEAAYLGAADAFVDRVLKAANTLRGGVS